MNAEQLINMIVRRVLRIGVDRGINAGIDAFARKGKSREEMTPEERAQAKKGRQTAGSARRMLRMGRRIGRF